MSKIWGLIIIVVIALASLFLFRSGKPEAKVLGTEISREDPNHPVEVYYGSAQIDTLNKMLEELNVVVYPEDKINALPSPTLRIGSKITITRATPLELTDAKVKKVYRTWTKTVGDFIAENKLDLLGQDSVEPTEETEIYYNMSIKITRVAEIDIVEKEPIKFKTVKKYNNDLEKGTKNILQRGKDGEKAVTYHIKRVDGEEVSRKVTNTEVISEPVEEIQEIGTWVKVYDYNGVASWYGIWPYLARISDNAYYAAAHDLGTYPKGTQLWVVNKANGKGVKVTVLDYMENPECSLDLSKAAFSAIASLGAGIIDIRIEKYYPN